MRGSVICLSAVDKTGDDREAAQPTKLEWNSNSSECVPDYDYQSSLINTNVSGELLGVSCVICTFQAPTLKMRSFREKRSGE
jgi:hypothetical protein